MAYFDNAATTYPKPECVYTYMDQYYRANGASAGRGDYKKSLSTTQLVSDTRENIRQILECSSKQVIFTPSATIALNIIIQGLLQNGSKNVYVTPFEHNAVTRILQHFEKLGRISLYQLTVSDSLCYDLSAISRQFEKNKPEIVILSHASNVCGLIAPVEEISILAKRYSAAVVVDMAQTAGLVSCNTGLETIDFAVFAGHKTLYGPTGISGFAMNPSIQLPAILFGGTGYDSANQEMPVSLPERYEMGTLNTVGIAGLNAATKWLLDTGIDRIRDKERENRAKLLEILLKYDFIRSVGFNADNQYIGVVSVLIDGLSSDSCGGVFDNLGISVRAGLQCAPMAHRFLGTFPAGTVRFSVGYFTSDDDFSELSSAIDFLVKNL